MVVDECDSTMGCDPDHDCQPPCANNIVDASKAGWEGLLWLMTIGAGWILHGQML
jgi:hypothetical protein